MGNENEESPAKLIYGPTIVYFGKVGGGSMFVDLDKFR